MKLTKKQKQILDEQTQLNENVFLYDDLPMEIKEQLLSIKDYETLLHDVDRYLSDLFFNNKKE